MLAATLDYDIDREVDCPLFFMPPAEEPELHIPEDEAAIEQPLLAEAGDTEKLFSANTSDWD